MIDVALILFKIADKLLSKTQPLYSKSQVVSNISLASNLFILIGKILFAETRLRAGIGKVKV